MDLKKEKIHYDNEGKSNLCKKYLENTGNLFGLENIKKELLIKKLEKIDNFLRNYCKYSKSKLSEINYNPVFSPDMKDLGKGSFRTLYDQPILELKSGTGMMINTIIEYLKIKYRKSDVCFLTPGKTYNISNINAINLSLIFNSPEKYKVVINKLVEQKQRDFISNCDKRFVFGYFILRIQNNLGGRFKKIDEMQNFHLNAFIYDKTKNLFELFEPLGYLETLNDFPIEMIYKEIEKKLVRILPKDFRFKVVDIDFQYKEEEIDRKRSIIDPFGFCAYWSAWALEQKLKSPNGSFRNLLIAKKKTIGDFRRFIRGFALLMNKIFSDFLMITRNLDELVKDEDETNQKILEFVIKTYLLTLTE
jgi:hypothetical protein